MSVVLHVCLSWFGALHFSGPRCLFWQLLGAFLCLWSHSRLGSVFSLVRFARLGSSLSLFAWSSLARRCLCEPLPAVAPSSGHALFAKISLSAVSCSPIPTERRVCMVRSNLLSPIVCLRLFNVTLYIALIFFFVFFFESCFGAEALWFRSWTSTGRVL